MSFICDFVELQLMVFGDLTPTEAERAVLNYVHAQAESEVQQFLKYDPVQKSETEYYPRLTYTGEGSVTEVWDVNTAHTRAIVKRLATSQDNLQLERLPLRTVSSLRVDHSGHWNTVSPAFEAGDAWTEGEDFYPKWHRASYCPTGIMEANGSWPTTPGSVQITYVGGYSRLELAGQAHATSASDQDGMITVRGVNAAGIKRAVVLTVMAAMISWAQLKKKTGTGLLGMLESEKLGDYSYKLGGGGAGGILNTLLTVAMPPQAEAAAEPFRNYGMMRI